MACACWCEMIPWFAVLQLLRKYIASRLVRTEATEAYVSSADTAGFKLKTCMHHNHMQHDTMFKSCCFTSVPLADFWRMRAWQFNPLSCLFQQTCPLQRGHDVVHLGACQHVLQGACMLLSIKPQSIIMMPTLDALVSVPDVVTHNAEPASPPHICCLLSLTKKEHSNCKPKAAACYYSKSTNTLHRYMHAFLPASLRKRLQAAIIPCHIGLRKASGHQVGQHQGMHAQTLGRLPRAS